MVGRGEVMLQGEGQSGGGRGAGHTFLSLYNAVRTLVGLKAPQTESGEDGFLRKAAPECKMEEDGGQGARKSQPERAEEDPHGEH